MNQEILANTAKDGDYLRLECGCFVRVNNKRMHPKFTRVEFVKPCKTGHCWAQIYSRTWRTKGGTSYRYLSPHLGVQLLDPMLVLLVQTFDEERNAGNRD